MKRMLITMALILPGSVSLAFVAPDISFPAHLMITIMLFLGGVFDGKFNWDTE